jgi:hypothetical protein
MLVMIVVFACAVLFGRSYDAKIGSGQTARMEAWKGASSGCDQKGDVKGPAGAFAKNAGGQQSDSLIAKAANAFFSLVPRSGKTADQTTQAPALLGGATLRFRTALQVACNEEPDTHGDALSIMSWAFDLFGDLVQGALVGS